MDNPNYPVKLNNSLTEVNTGMIQGIGDMGDAIVTKTLDESQNFIARAFNPGRRAIRQGELDIIKVEQRSRREMLQTAKAAQLQVLRETCNQYLARGKAASRAETSSFLLDQAQKLMEEADRISERFIDNIERKAQTLDSIKTPRLRQVVEAQLDQEVKEFFNLRNQLTEKFRNIVSEGV